MDRRFFLFLALAFAILMANAQILIWLRGPQPKQDAMPSAAQEDKSAPQAPPEETDAVRDGHPEAPAAAPQADDQARAEAAAAAAPAVEPAWLTLGSAAPDGPFEMLVTLTNRGAAIERIELSNRQYREIERRDGYLGHLTLEEAGPGVRARTVGPGTPAAVAGLRPGDVIVQFDAVKIEGLASYQAALGKTRPNDTITLRVDRDGGLRELKATLTRWPLQVVRPEGGDPLSLLTTLAQFDREKLAPLEAKLIPPRDDKQGWNDFLRAPPPWVELPGVDLRSGFWEVAEHSPREVTFRKSLPASGLEFRKRYWLEESPRGAQRFHLNFELTIVNQGQQPRQVAYQLDGPTGLPTEGWWYATRIGREWFRATGLRDAAFGVQSEDRTHYSLVRNEAIIAGDAAALVDADLLYAGVDAQYFASALLPHSPGGGGSIVALAEAIRVGAVPPESDHRKLTNVSVRLVSPVTSLEPGEQVQSRYRLFAGPKQDDVLAAYGLSDLNYFGWPIFRWVSRPLTAILHFFHDALPINYGLSIVLLTVLVRLAMFPLSRQQTLMAQKMQALQPELKRISEKYKTNMEERARAQQEFMRKHNYNPLSGCLPALVQLPIFIGLYRALSVDVQLRDAPLLWEGFPWATNLSAPDMLFYWGAWMPQFVQGWLGPYFNLLPVLTIGLFLWQQKMFMPPPTDEQSRMQAKVMQYMMVFMGVMFFRVASGLCLYFIVSTLWGIGERKLMPKLTPAASGDAAAAVPAPASVSGGNGTAIKIKRPGQKGRK